VDGWVSNCNEAAVEKWIDLVGEIKPMEIQIYSTDWASAEKGLEIVPPWKLKKIADQVEGILRIPVQAYWAK